MDIASFILAAMLSLGLVGTDAVMNAGDINFDIQVTDDLTKKGFTTQLVNAMMDNDLRELIDFRSIVHPPQIRSPQDKSVVGEIATTLKLQGVTTAFQADFGFNPVHLAGSLMPNGKDNQQLRFILAGDSRHTGQFHIDTTSDMPLPAFLQDVAVQLVGRLDPYAAAFHQFKLMSGKLINHAPPTEQAAFRTFIDQLIVSENGGADSDLDHAAFHNLLGLSALMIHDTAQAEDEFKKSASLDPRLGVPEINLAVEYVSEHRFDEAIAMADAAAKAPKISGVPYVMSNAYTVKALALWGEHDLQAASDNFLTAVKIYPGGLWSYFYWAELCESAHNTKDAALLRERAEANMLTSESVSEIAFPHLRVRTDADFALQPIEVTWLRRVSDIYEQK
jgi:tetratricopeptide (TPR) repeat protein